MLLLTDSGLCTVWVVRECQCEDFIRHLPTIPCKSHVVLLVNRFEFGMKTTNHCILESLRLNLCPILNLVRWDILHIVCFVIRGPSVCAVSTYRLHQLVVLVRNGILRCLLRYAVNLCIYSLAFRLVSGCTIDLEQTLNLIKQRLLSLVVLSSELVSTLEHQMLKVVRQTCRLGRVILRAYTHGNHRLQTRLLLVYRHIDLQSVFECIYAGSGLIALYALVAITARNGNHRNYNC